IMAVRKKQDDKYLLALRELVNSGAGNRQCFDCSQKGPTYVNMTIGSFVCTRCSGVLRGLTPPHRVKSISMATFTQEELDFLKAHGNELCAKTWLGLWDPKRATPQQDQRELMIDKYERKRYYLEPASPLKSLANAVNLKTTSNSNNGYHNGYASIHLTPPAAQRTAANGLSAKTPATTTASSAISRPQHHHHHQQHQQQQDAFNMSAGGLGLISSLNSAGSTSTGALSDTSSCASNGFAGETDFVADFGTANIFDATSSTSARSTGSPAVSSASSVGSSNGYAKVQPLRAAHLQQQQLLNGNANLNGNGAENFADFEHAPIYNGIAATSYFNWSDGSTPNLFPDPFESVQESSSLPSYSLWSSESRSSRGRELEKPREREKPPEQAVATYKSSVTSLMSTRSFCSSSCDDSGEDSLAALSSTLTPTNPFLPYLLQSSSSTSEAAVSRRSSLFSYNEDPEPAAPSAIPAETNSNSNLNSSSSVNILNAYYNPFFTWSNQLGHLSQSQHNNSPKGAQVGGSAPSEDRYAALKDLDEQLRELKASEAVATEAPTPTNGNVHMADAFSSAGNNIINNINNNANPFKSQQQQQQQQLLNGNGHLVNPFQANNNSAHQQQQQQQQQNLYGQLTLIPNGYGSSPIQAGGQQQLMHQQLPAHASFFNFNNNGFAVAQGLPNGCGFGSMQPAPVMAGGINGAFNNPFA
ncbi:hypothetical protein KR044_001516, partial [Drosophila immigrans]